LRRANPLSPSAIIQEILKGVGIRRHTKGVNAPYFAPSALVPTRPGDPPDTSLVDQFRVVYEDHYDDLWRYCLRRAGSVSDAEDVLSETFTVAWRKFEDAPTGHDVRPWLFTIARNHLRNSWRKSKRRRTLTSRVISEDPPRPADDPATLALDDSAAVIAALGRLKERDQELLQLATWDELPHREIATILDCSENAVAIGLHRARKRLRDELDSAQSSGTRKENRKVRGTQNTLPVPEPTHEKGHLQ